MSNVIIETRGITKTYGTGELKNSVLKGIEIEVEKGEILSIMGPSGCGKTTLLNILGGLDRPTNGSIFVKGRSLMEMSDGELTRFRLNNIGFVFQFFNLIPSLTVVENVKLPLLVASRTRKEVMERPQYLLDQVDMLDKGNRMPFELSGGEQQRVAVARALANSPSIILADEPTGNLDSANSAKLIDLFNMINEEKKQTIILVTHDYEVAQSTERIIYMKDGNTIEDRRLKAQPRSIKTDLTNERVKIIQILSELDDLFICHDIRQDLYEKIRQEYVNQLIEIEIEVS